MKKSVKVSLIIGGALIILGAAIAFFGLLSVNFDYSALNFDFTNMNSVSYTTKSYEVVDNFNDIYIEESSADIIFALSDDDKTIIKCYEREDINYNVDVKDGVLNIIREKDSMSLSVNFSLSTKNPKVTVYLPKQEYKKLTIDCASGNVTVSDKFIFDYVNVDTASGSVELNSEIKKATSVSTASGEIFAKEINSEKISLNTASGFITVEKISNSQEINLTSTSGSIGITDVNCKAFICESSSGGQIATDVIAGNINMQASSGSIYLYDCDADMLYFDTSSGSVYGELLSGKTFVADSGSGDINVPKIIQNDGGICEAYTSSGDIDFVISR